MSPLPLRHRLLESVQAWRPDSGFDYFRRAQERAQREMLAVLRTEKFFWNPLYQPGSSDRPIGIRLFLLNVTTQMWAQGRDEGWTDDFVPVRYEKIPNRFDTWQQVVLDRLRYTGIPGASADITSGVDDWWLSLCWVKMSLGKK